MRALRRALVLCVLALGTAALGSETAAAAATCTYSAGVVTVDLPSNNDLATLKRSGPAITMNGAPCGAATRSNTDQIDVNGAAGAQTFGIDLSGGRFTKPSGDAIPFSIDLGADHDTLYVQGTAGRDFIFAGSGGINLSGQHSPPQVSVQTTGVEDFLVYGSDSSDVISAGGGSGTGGPSTLRAVLRGEGGNDILTGGDVTDSIRGGPGNDTIDGGASEDTVEYLGAPVTGVKVNLSTGKATGDGVDHLTNVEDVMGSSGPDLLVGDGGPNQLNGSAGDDRIFGAGGSDQLYGVTGHDVLRGQGGPDLIQPGADDDTVDGGNGIDTVDYSDSPTPVTVSLSAGTATGDGTDSLAGIENAVGSNFGDSLTGSDGPNILIGLSGDDTLSGLAGNDTLLGGPDNDTLDGGPDVDHCQQDSGSGSTTNCE